MGNDTSAFEEIILYLARKIYDRARKKTVDINNHGIPIQEVALWFCVCVCAKACVCYKCSQSLSG